MRRLAPARDRARRSPDAGMSVVETVVAMSIASILLAGIATVFIGSLQVVRVVTAKTATTADARIGMEAMTRSMRVAVRPDGLSSALVSATGSTVSFYALLNRTGGTSAPTPTLVAYAWDGTCLNQSLTTASAVANPPASGPFYTWPTTNRTTTCLLRTTTAPTFTYFASGLLSSGGVATAPLTVPAGGLDTATLPTVQSIGISLTAKDATAAGVNGVTMVDRVTLTNVVAGGS